MYRVIPISRDSANEVRRNMVSPFGKLPASSSVATGYGPCRSCLKTFRQGEEERIYITYDPFAGVSKLPLPGPVFIHTEECAEYKGEIFPTNLLSIPLIFEGYGDGSRLAASERIDAKRFNEQIADILAKPNVNFNHLRNGEAGCFITRIERTGNRPVSHR
jgi:hypothetical protein